MEPKASNSPGSVVREIKRRIKLPFQNDEISMLAGRLISKLIGGNLHLRQVYRYPHILYVFLKRWFNNLSQILMRISLY